jgi:hypothetical protein
MRWCLHHLEGCTVQQVADVMELFDRHDGGAIEPGAGDDARAPQLARQS